MISNWFDSFLSYLSVVNQYYESQVYDEFVIKGNSAVFKCQIPSFVADHVEIIEWVDTNGGSYIKNATGISFSSVIRFLDHPFLVSYHF